jgi:hypothetical protein
MCNFLHDPYSSLLGPNIHLNPSSSAEVKGWVELYLCSPNLPSWHGAQLSTGTTLPLPLSSSTRHT